MSSPLDALFNPRSVAIVGASRSRDSIGGQILHNVVSAELRGAIYPVNPHTSEVASLSAFPSVRAIPGDVDLAIIAVPRPAVMGVIEDCGAKHVRCAVVITAGYAELGEAGAAAQRALGDRGRELGIRLVGPNCLGVLNTDRDVRLNATFGQSRPPAGAISFCSQSGALGLAVLDYARDLGLGIRQFVSVGNKVDVSTNDLLEHWEQDDETRVILLYVESFGNPRRFLEIARRVSRRKPILVLKSGRGTAGARAAQSHTGALAAKDAGVEALIAQAGVVRVGTLEELFDGARLLASQPLARGPRVGIVTNAGGPAIIAADALEAHGLVVPSLSRESEERLRAVLVPEASVRNPVDMVAGAHARDYASALAVVAHDPAIDSALVMLVPTKTADTVSVAKAIATVPTHKPLVACVLGSVGVAAQAVLGEAHIPSYGFPERAAAACAIAARYQRLRSRVVEAPPESKIVHPRFRGSRWLEPADVDSLLRAYGLTPAESRVVASAGAAADAAESVGFPVALKIVSSTITHKTEASGVVLGLSRSEDVQAQCRALLGRVGVDAVLVQRMAPKGVEVFVGLTRDPSLGALVAFGTGGTAVELWKDVVFRVAPLSHADAREMMEEIRGKPLLDGFRGAPAADRDAIERAIVAVSEIAVQSPEIAEIDINPLIALEPGRGAIVVDARVRIEEKTS